VLPLLLASLAEVLEPPPVPLWLLPPDPADPALPPVVVDSSFPQAEAAKRPSKSRQQGKKSRCIKVSPGQEGDR